VAGLITAVVPVSPIKSHPDTAILEETVASIRHHLPDCEIILTFDGVRAEQESRRGDYEEAIRKTLWLAKGWGAVCPFVFDQHLHQTGMMRRIIDEIRTDLLLYVESDTPLVTDECINFHMVEDFILTGGAELVRFHHEAVIPDAHRHMIHSDENSDLFVRTSQWSQRPHAASVAFYRRVMDCFTPDANSFIEDKMHSICSEAYKLDGMSGWRQWPLSIYNPGLGTNMKRSYHTDGRAGEEKYERAQVF
jgi:hypothetical protein